MKAKPKGPKYRNLFARGDVIYYQRVVSGRRVRFSCETAEWNDAAAVRDLYEQRKGIGRVAAPLLGVPTLRDFARRYLEEDTGHLAGTTRRDRDGHLRQNGPLLSYLGAKKLDELTPALLREWWGTEIAGRGLSTKTGRAYLDTLASTLGYARDLGLIETSPVGDFREMLRRRSRTKQARTDSDPGRHVRPIEEPAQLARLTAAAREEGRVPAVLVLLCLDAGLRLGEAIALRWGSIDWGADDGDTTRSLLIGESRPRGGSPTTPKSGRARRVALSWRLRGALLELCRERFTPSPEALVLDYIEPNNFRHREWRRICARAEIGHRQLKDLRDTFASQLLTAGIPLGYISAQLGHADVAVTARHYARWVAGDGYRAPTPLESGEVPADVLSRFESPQSNPTAATGLRIVSRTRKEKPSESHDFRGFRGGSGGGI